MPRNFSATPAKLLGEALDVQLVNQCLVPGGAGRPIVAPGEGRVHDAAERAERRVVAAVQGKVGRGVAEFVAEQRIVPMHLAANRLGIRVQDDLFRIEAVPVGRLVGTVNPVAVKLVGLNVGQVTVPDLVGMFAENNALGFGRCIGGVEQAQLDLGGMLGKKREVDAAPRPRSRREDRVVQAKYA